MISVIIRLNRISRHYRYVMRVLAREKIQLKVSPVTHFYQNRNVRVAFSQKKPDFGSGRRARNMKWIPQ